MNYRQRKDGYFEVYLGKVNGKRIRKVVKDEPAAKAAIKDHQKKKDQLGRAAFAISDEEVMEFIQIKRRLENSGASLHDAVEFFERFAKPMGDEMQMEDLVSRVLDVKLGEGKRPRYLSQLKCSGMSFCNSGHSSTWAHEITAEDVERWLRGNGWAPKTQNVYLTDLRTIFSYALEKGIITRNPAAEVKKLSLEDAEIAILSYSDCLRLLVRATRPARGQQEDFSPLVPYLIIGLFCGIRPEELARMEWSEVDLDEGTVLVAAAKSKTRQRRVVDLSSNAMEWLGLVPESERSGSLLPKNFRRRWDRFRRAAGFRVKVGDELGRPWPHDAMRHTYASMHYAFHQNEFLLQAQMGHTSGQMLFKHYRAVATRKEAERFWKIRPAA